MRKLTLRILPFIALSLFTGTVRAESIVAQLSDYTARFFYSSQVWGQQAGPIEIELGVMFTEDKLTQDDTIMGNLGVLIRNDTMDSPVIISIGGRGYYADVNNRYANIQVTGLALGGEVLIVPDNLGGLGLGFGLFIAPNVVTGLDADGLYEYSVKLDFQVTPQASIYLGYEKIVASLKDVDFSVTVESGFHLGLSIRF
ncbi:MAG: hypothetical protein OEZ39_08645 [Gammaproteobacteria bacterium]|nr:hypothetical protein [Gammaproteobacteria bacterium]MDH5651931.1 hypothetical protein [Gammaproteobacteria bacterium]